VTTLTTVVSYDRLRLERGESMKECKSVYNIRETKSQYSSIQKAAIKGLPVFTKNKNEEMSVAHIHEQLMLILLRGLPIDLSIDYDEELAVYTIAFEKINLYGEGKTKEEAKEDLLTSVLEWIDIYRENIDRYQGLFDDDYKAYMLKLMVLACDRENLEKEFNL